MIRLPKTEGGMMRERKEFHLSRRRRKEISMMRGLLLLL